jgi:hypothetical protein
MRGCCPLSANLRAEPAFVSLPVALDSDPSTMTEDQLIGPAYVAGKALAPLLLLMLVQLRPTVCLFERYSPSFRPQTHG